MSNEVILIGKIGRRSIEIVRSDIVRIIDEVRKGNVKIDNKVVCKLGMKVKGKEIEGKIMKVDEMVEKVEGKRKEVMRKKLEVKEVGREWLVNKKKGELIKKEREKKEKNIIIDKEIKDEIVDKGKGKKL